jgi:phosphohistidine phosphatase
VKRLTLVRHAKSGQKDGSIPDFDRPLNSRGKEDAPEMGRRLAARGCAPEAVVTSPAKRARMTAEKVVRELDYRGDAIHEDDRIYDASAGTLLEVIGDLDDAWDHVLLVGHNPGFEDLANLLGNLEFGALPTCGVVCLDFPVDTWNEVTPGTGTLVFLDFPKNDARGT